MENRVRPILILLLVLLSCSVAAAQNNPLSVVTGIVTDSATGEPLRFVTVRIAGASNGAVTNVGGHYLVKLAHGRHTLSFSMVGYRTERREIDVQTDTVSIDVALHSASLEYPSVVVSAEDPGVRLMRAAIRRKLRQRDSLATYTYTLYTKFVASTDTSTAGRADGPHDTTIASIFESYSHGYFRRPNSYFNEIFQRRQSANVPATANFVAFGTNLDAYDDMVTILGEEIATPFHPNAIDYYDFVLEGNFRAGDSSVVSRIRVTPKGEARRLFSGYVDLDPDRSIPVAVNLVPNRAVQLPFDASLRYSQQFDEVDGRFVLPTGMRITSSLSVSLFWIINPRIDIMIETVAYDYHTNIPLGDDLFDQRRVELAPEADGFDSVYWRDRQVLPLRPEEATAYEAIRRTTENPDSAAGRGLVDKLLGGITRQIGRLTRPPFTGFEDILRYNRVQGGYLGLGLHQYILDKRLEGSLKGGYGFADRRGYGEIELRGYLDARQRIALEAGVYRRLARRDDPNVVGITAISLGSLLFKNDYGDYYYADGYNAAIEFGFGQMQYIRREMFARPTTITLSFRDELERSAPNRTSFAVFGKNHSFRPDPPIIDGRLRSVGLELNLGYSPFRRISNVGLRLAAEVSDPRILGSDYDFQQYTGTLLLRTQTLPLWELDFRLSGGYSRGAVPPQRFFSLESSLSSTAAVGAFRGMNVKEFYGDRFAALSLEHSFGEVIPGVLRIPNLASFGIELIALGGVGWTEFSRDARFATVEGVPFVPPTTDGTADRFYYEAGLGLNRLLIFLRADITARLSQSTHPHFFFTLSLAT